MICNELAKATGAIANPVKYGPIITAVIALGFTGSVPVWWKAGTEYTKRMLRKEQAANK